MCSPNATLREKLEWCCKEVADVTGLLTDGGEGSGKKSSDSEQIRVMHWNILADWAAFDGFVARVGGVDTASFITDLYWHEVTASAVAIKKQKFPKATLVKMGLLLSRYVKSGICNEEIEWDKDKKDTLENALKEEGMTLFQKYKDHVDRLTIKARQNNIDTTIAMKTYCDLLFNLLNWERRCGSIARAILSHSPDIVGLVELDKRQDLQNYFSEKTFHHSHTLTHIDSSGNCAFVGKNTLKDGMRDGSAIFWNPTRFRALIIKTEFFQANDEWERNNPEGQGGIVGVLLKDLLHEHKHVYAFATHLKSGDTDVNEDERLVQIKQTVIPFINKLRADALDMLKKEAEKPRVASVLFMDGNSAPHFAQGRYADGTTTNVFATLAKNLKPELENFAPRTCDYVTVNKIRGPTSEQPHKVGEYQLNIIDYLMKSADLEWIEEPSKHLPLFTPEQHAKPDKYHEVTSQILPSSECPSDHYPVKGVLSYKQG